MKNDLVQLRLPNIWLQIHWQVARLGTIGKIGVGLFVVALVFFLAAVLPQNTTIHTLKERVETMRVQQSPSNRQSVPGKIISDDQALQIFYDFFPRIDSSPFWIRELVRVAKQRDVEINSSDFRLIHDKGARLTHYEMILPIRGRYTQVRAFIADALEVVPAMAITGILIKREDVRTEQLDVRLEINLYLDD